MLNQMGYRISKILVVLIILCTLVASAFTCFAFCYFNFPIFSTLIIPLVFLLTMFFPSVGISALLILLPVFGNKPGSTQATYLIVVQSAIIGHGSVFQRSGFATKSLGKKSAWELYVSGVKGRTRNWPFRAGWMD